MSAHEGKTVRCGAELPSGDGDDGRTEICDQTLTFRDDGRYVSSPRGDDRRGTALRERFEAAALRFDCPECGATKWVCPICSDHLLDDPDGTVTAAPGWFVGASTGDRIACHNCNQREAMRQRASGRRR